MTIRELIENGTITLETQVDGVLPLTMDNHIAGHGALVSEPSCGTYRVIIESWPPEHSFNPVPLVSWGGPGHGAERLSDFKSAKGGGK